MTGAKSLSISLYERERRVSKGWILAYARMTTWGWIPAGVYPVQLIRGGNDRGRGDDRRQEGEITGEKGRLRVRNSRSLFEKRIIPLKPLL
jgi:hypothetical protein